MELSPNNENDNNPTKLSFQEEISEGGLFMRTPKHFGLQRNCQFPERNPFILSILKIAFLSFDFGADLNWMANPQCSHCRIVLISAVLQNMVLLSNQKLEERKALKS